MSSEERIDALEEVRDVIASHNLPPIKQRKFNGIFNAMEMQIEDDDFSPEAVEHLGNAVIAVASARSQDHNVRVGNSTGARRGRAAALGRSC